MPATFWWGSRKRAGVVLHFGNREEDYLGITEEMNEVSQGKGKHRMGPRG